ncbi:hypothetical protein Adt_05915 [Abeliophyllum distichum]|uniref:Uncharacterized protein n=1 Tax=Abeliophyllum distichum TaxID=126358 RepID=A0ABD1V5I1_9LAMI
MAAQSPFVYSIRKKLGHNGLQEMEFNEIEGDMILKQEYRDNFERIKWSFPMTVVDDDTKQTHDHLQLMKKEKGRSRFGFYDDWRQKIVKTENFMDDEEIGFYVDPNIELRTTRRFISRC